MVSFFQDTRFDFLGKRYWAFGFSIILIAASFAIWFRTGDEKFGTDFRGGHEIIVDLAQLDDVNATAIRNALSSLPDPVVQSFSASSGQYTIRIAGDAPAQEVRDSVVSLLKERFSGEVEIIQADFVGPTIGKELRKSALIAVIFGLLGILIYISLRFEFAFALGTVVALFHDVIISFGAYLYAQHTINMATLAAALTIVGYSANDTIIVFDRVREEILKRQRFDLKEVMNTAINATLSRTFITSLTTLFSAAALLIFGGGSINDLAFFLVVGIITGTYSTVFIAAPVALLWDRFRHPDKVRENQKREEITRGEVQV
jgi:preprotein translocase subunit SecF